MNTENASRYDSNNGQLDVSLGDSAPITAWVPPDPGPVAQYVANTIIDSDSDVIVFYIGASNTFPLHQFEKLVPKEQNVSKIYESVRIQITLNLNELSSTLRKILQFVSREKVTRHLARAKSNQQKGLSILIMISGIEIMFKNSKMSLPQDPHHTILRDLFLRLRVEANHSNDQLILRTFVVLPLSECQKCQISLPSGSTTRYKRQRMTPTTLGNSVGDYIVKFYADTLIT